MRKVAQCTQQVPLSYHTKFQGVLTTLPRVINGNIKVFLRCTSTVTSFFDAGSGFTEFPLSGFSLQNSSLRDFVSTYILVLSVFLRTWVYGALKNWCQPQFSQLLLLCTIAYRAGLFCIRILYVDVRCTLYGVRALSVFEFLTL
jgi:hypothetical protein